MQEGRNAVCDVTNAICDGLRQIGDFSYAVLPRDLAYACGGFKKAVLGQIRNCVEWDMKWIDDRLAGGDKLREEWREKCRRQTTTATDTTTAPGV